MWRSRIAEESKTGRADVFNWIIVRVVDSYIYDTEISLFVGSAA